MDTDVLGGPLVYPDCKPRVEALKITLSPGQVGGIHQHLTPLFAYVLSGELSVTYEQGDGITKIYREGDALMDAMNVMHHGFNQTDEPVTLLAVYMNCAE